MINCLDLYCGAGGLSLGLQRAGINVLAAVDISVDCKRTYERNFGTGLFIQKDMNDLAVSELELRLSKPGDLLIAGGPPCQLFSRLNKQGVDAVDGLKPYIRVIRELAPKYVVFENVPNILNRGRAWNYLLNAFARLKYKVSVQIVRAVRFGVAQIRERAIIIASRDHVRLKDGPAITNPRTVKDAIGHFPDSDASIPNHVTLKLSPENERKIRSLKSGGKSRDGGPFSDSYARMAWTKPAPTMTTKCISFSNGRFGHPKYNRGITVREAASLQSFPETFEFFGSLWSCARQVGNAVPPLIAEAIGEAILKNLSTKRRQCGIRHVNCKSRRVPKL